MSTTTTFTDTTAAESKSVGFDYQYYFFLWKLLSLNTGESVGLEVKDDVHTELNNNTQILYQIKHSIKKKASGETKNLTSADKDLWKTLSNWIHVITDVNDNRSKITEQLEFINKTSFVLASNKSSSDQNIVTKSIVEFQDEIINFHELKSVFNNVKESTKDKKINKYISDVIFVDDNIVSAFFKKVYFELDEKDIISKCKDAIKADKVPELRVDDVYAKLDSAIREDNFIKIRNGEKIEITFDEYYTRYRRYYDLARSSSLLIKKFSGELPEKIEEQIFIKQLLEIGDVDFDDWEDIFEYTRYRLKLVNNIDEWLQRGEITKDELEEYNTNAFIKWKNEFKRSNPKKLDAKDFDDKALNLLFNIREKELEISGQKLGADLCNGTYYNLSNIPTIGWRKDWEKYKK